MLFVAWLVLSNRLDMDRVYAIREILVATIDEEHEHKRIAEDEAIAAEQAIAAAAARENPMPPSSHQISYSDLIDQKQRDNARRASDDIARLRRELELERADFLRERLAFEEEKSAWDGNRSAVIRQSSDDQFRQAVQLLEGLPSKQAKEMLIKMIDEGDMGRAVACLAAMKSYTATKVVREFKTDAEQQVATELLNRLMALGSPPDAQGPSTNAGSASSDN